MPRIVSLHSSNQPSSRSKSNRHRRIGRGSYLHPPARLRSGPGLTYFRRPRTLGHTKHRPRKAFSASRHSTSRHSTAAHRPSTSSWKSKFRLHSRTVPEPQPLTLEEKLRVDADRIRRFERQTRVSHKPQIHLSSTHQSRTKPKTHPRPHTGTSARLKPSLHKRDRFKNRLNTLGSGKF